MNAVLVVSVESVESSSCDVVSVTVDVLTCDEISNVCVDVLPSVVVDSGESDSDVSARSVVETTAVSCTVGCVDETWVRVVVCASVVVC